MESAKRALQEAAEMHRCGERGPSFFKWVEGYFACMSVLEGRVLFREAGEELRLQASKAEKVLQLAEKALVRAEHCLPHVLEASAEQAEIEQGMAAVILKDAVVENALPRKQSVRRSSLHRQGAAARAQTEPVPEIPVTVLQFCWYELTYKLQRLAQHMHQLYALKAKEKASAIYLGSLRLLLAQVRTALEDRDGIEEAEAEAEAVSFGKFVGEDLEDVAKHLTLIDFSLFRRIRAGPWIEGREMRANLDWHRFVRQCVQWEMVNPAFPIDRAAVMAKMVRIASALKDRCSFNMLRAVVDGIERVSAAMTTTRELFRTHHRDAYIAFDRLRSFVSEEHNYKGLRFIMAKCPKPCIPYFGIFQQDLAAFKAGQAAGVEPSRECRANWETTLAHFKACQKHPYVDQVDRRPDIMMQHWLLSRCWCDSGAIEALIAEREGRHPKEPAATASAAYVSATNASTAQPEAPRDVDDAAIREQEPLGDDKEGISFQLIQERIQADRRMSGFDRIEAEPEPAAPPKRHSNTEAHFVRPDYNASE